MSGSREEINALVRLRDEQLRQEFGDELVAAGWCLLLGRYYGESPVVYFSLNPGHPRSRSAVDPTSWGDWNVPFVNPPELRREYVYLHNCERFFASSRELSEWIQDRVTSAFLIPWRTGTLSEVTQMNRATRGKVFEYSREIAQRILRDHRASMIVAAGKAALELMTRMQVVEGLERETAVMGSGGSYQWSRWRATIDDRAVTILQIPHFSRANSPSKMRELVSWMRQEMEGFGRAAAEERGPILAVDE